MSSGYRSWEEREAEALRTRAEADRLKAETIAITQAAEAGAARTETEQIAERVKQARLLKQLTAVEADADDDKANRDEKRAEARLDKGVAFKQLVTALVITGLLASLPSLIAYFLGLRADGKPDTGPAWYMLSVPFFLELLAWTSVKGTQWAVRRGFARWPFWILTLGLAGFAGFINGTKGAEMFGPVAGWALASTSVFGPVLWEVREFIEARTADDNRSVAERAAEKAEAKQRAAVEKAEAERIAKQDKEREKEFPEEYAEYRRIMIAHPLGEKERDDAWAEAWNNLHRLPLARTALTLSYWADAHEAIDEVMSRASMGDERLAVDRLLEDLFPASPKGDDDPGSPSSRKGPSRPPQAPTALGGIENKALQRTPDAKALEPLDEEDLEAARRLRKGMSQGAFSTPVVAKLIGRRWGYAKRIRDAVNAEQQ